MKKNNKEKNWSSVNKLIIFILWCGSIYFVITIRISMMLFQIGFFVNFALALVYRYYKKKGCFRKAVIALRAVAVTLIVLAVLVPVILLNFEKNKFIYPVKRFCYSYRNYILPSGLPKKCDDYLFITQGSFPAQDYHPSAYLAFHTDSETLKEYKNYFDSLDSAECKVTHMPEIAYDDSWLKCPEELPQHVFGQLQSEHIHDFKNAVIYIVPAYYNKGCMLDYDSGLAVFWY